MKKNIITTTYIFSFLFFSCGLPSYDVVEPPINIIATTTYVSFDIPPDPNIYGFEIYYKIYSSTADSNTITSDSDALDYELDSYNFTQPKQKLNNLNFKRMLKVDAGEIFLNREQASRFPLLLNDSEVSAGDTVKITIGAGINTIKINEITFAEPLRNTLDNTDSYYKSFYDEIVKSDDDNNSLDGETNIIISLTAFSVAPLILTNYQDSYPIFLGKLNVTIFD